mgnify:FL=1
MDMKKRIFLSMILLALCLIQASADDYYYKIKLYNDEWSGYIKVSYDDQKDVYNNGLSQLIAGKTVKDDSRNFTLLNKDNKVDLDKIYGIAFANEKGLAISDYQKIMLGVEFDAWKQIRQHIKYLELRDYKCDTYTNSGYFMDMFNVEKLELPKDGMTVGDGDDDCQYYFSNAHNLKEITIQSDGNTVDITETNKVLLNRVGKYMFSNCWNLSSKYTNRLLKDVEEIKRNAFFTNDDDRDKLAYNKMVIEIPNSVKEIGYQAFYNRVNVTGLNIQGNGELVIGSEAFKACDELAKISLTQDNKVPLIPQHYSLTLFISA